MVVSATAWVPVKIITTARVSRRVTFMVGRPSPPVLELDVAHFQRAVKNSDNCDSGKIALQVAPVWPSKLSVILTIVD